MKVHEVMRMARDEMGFSREFVVSQIRLWLEGKSWELHDFFAVNLPSRHRTIRKIRIPLRRRCDRALL